MPDDDPIPLEVEALYAGKIHDAVKLKLAGIPNYQISQRLGIPVNLVGTFINGVMQQAKQDDAEKLREIENARLDLAQSRIWSQVLDGDLHAVEVFLRISTRRASLNGLDAPTNLRVSIRIKNEMETALAELERYVLGEIVDDGG